MKKLLFLLPLLILLFAGCSNSDAILQQQLQLLQNQGVQIQAIQSQLTQQQSQISNIQAQLGQVQYQTTQIQNTQPTVIEKPVPIYIPVPEKRLYVPPLPAYPQPWREHPDWQRRWNQIPFADQYHFQQGTK